MNKLTRILVMGAMAACFCVPAWGSAEAASVALLPLINNVQDDELSGQVYYKEAINKLNGMKGFFVVENDALNTAIDSNKTAGQVPDLAALKAIAEQGDVDIVFAMQLDQLDKKERMGTKEHIATITVKGKAVAYNRLNGAVYERQINGKKQMDVALTSRWDRVHEEFGRIVRVEVERAMNAK